MPLILVFLIAFFSIIGALIVGVLHALAFDAYQSGSSDWSFVGAILLAVCDAAAIITLGYAFLA